MIQLSESTPVLTILNDVDLPRLVRLCGRLSGSYEAADDLAQETLLEAWRLRRRLVDPSGSWQWLTAIARNVCLRWQRSQGTATTRQLVSSGDNEVALETAAGDDDFVLELEREELVIFLDRALALLPADTRTVLIAKYVEDFPQSAIAESLHLSEGAVEARLHRGKLMLRKLLSTNLRPEAESLGILVPLASGWHETRIWCPFCGLRHVEAYIDHNADILHYRCPGPCIPSGTIVGGSPSKLPDTLTSPKAILSRVLQLLHSHYQRTNLDEGKPCPQCGKMMPLVRWTEQTVVYGRGLEMQCSECGTADGATLWHLALDTPAAQRFWRRHPRMRALQINAIEYAGSPVLVSGFETMDGLVQLPVLFDPITLRVLQAGGEPC